MQNIIFTSSIVMPVFLLVFLGVFLKKKNLINEAFMQVSSKVVFRVALPSLVFQKISSTDYSKVLNPKQIVFAVVYIILFCLFAGIVTYFFTKNGKTQGAVIQASFRTNFSIIGFALIFNAFGEMALANAAILLAFIMPLLNILSVFALTIPLHREGNVNIKKIFKDIITNPLIIAAMAAVPFSFFHIQIHPIFNRTIGYLAGLTLPLALLSIGGSLSFHSVKKEFSAAALATFFKIVLMPAIGMFLAVYLGFRGMELGVLFFLFAGPTAIASYIMADAMGSNGELAGNIILTTTLGSIITLSLGLLLLKTLSLI